MFALYWVREDGQGDCCMGEYDTRAEAEAAIPAAKAELIAQAGEDWQKQEIENGAWRVIEE